MSIDITALPPELLVAPQPLIGFCGLDVQRNSVHKSIWDAFSSNRRSERPPVQYKLLPAQYEFPVAKPKRASYEWYHPKGILKRNWMLKHMHVLPSVVVLFQEMEWNDAQWTDKQLQCASTIQSLKHSLQERNTRLCLVLLQKAAPLPPGEDMLASERASSLTNACGLSTKMLFILPHTEHLMGYMLRLELAFLDMSQSYYALMSKRIRTHRDQLTASHTVLKIRHQFKLGFVSELKQDFSTALKHYTQSYANLDEIRIIDTNCLEIKTIAGFLSYKICRLMFKLKVPRDSINQFISHIEKYRNRIGFKDVVFEHYAWLSTQHSAFADLFCEAIKNGLPALQTQHPGIYYHKAAEYTAKRRESYQQCCALPSSSPEPTTPTDMQNTIGLFSEYFGIRVVKIGEQMSEQQLILLVQENEKNFKHSNAIIQMLGQAMAQFKIYKCLRFRKKLATDMAEEYFRCGDNAKALTLYSLMLPDYRQDKWPSILSDVLLKTLRCAFLSASVTDFISCSIEALSLKISYDQKDRILVLENLWKVFQFTPPISQSQIAPELHRQWKAALDAAKSPVHIDLDTLTELMKCCVTFERVELKNDEIINVFLILKLNTNVPIKLHNFAINISDGSQHLKLRSTKFTTFGNIKELRESLLPQNSSAIVYKNIESDLKMDPGKYYQLLFTTEAQKFVENTQLHVTRIEAHIGTDKLSAMLTKCATFARNAFRHYNRCRDLDDNIIINPVCYIAPTFHVSIQTDLGNEPMLVNEYHLVVTTVNNPYNVYLQNVGINLSVPNYLKNKVFLTSDVSPSRQKLHSQIQIDIGDLVMQSSNTASFYIFSLVETVIELQQAVFYSMDVVRPKNNASTESLPVEATTTPNSTDGSPVDLRPVASSVNALAIASSPIYIEFLDDSRLRKTREDVLTVRCMNEFEFVGRFYTLSRKALLKIYSGENFLFRSNIEVKSESPLDILETYFICDHNLVQSTYSFKRKKYTNSYRTGDKIEDVIVLRTNATSRDWVTSKEFEHNKSEPEYKIFSRTRHLRKQHDVMNSCRNDGALTVAGIAGNLNKSLVAKIPTNMTIINNSIANSIMLSSQSSNMSASTISDEGKLTIGGATASPIVHDTSTDASTLQVHKPPTTRMVYNKAMDAIQATGHCRGFIKGVVTTEHLQQQQQHPLFGVYCIKWRRTGCKEENESKFIITGRDVEEPPLNIYCSIEEKMFVKMPLTLKVVLRNPTEKVLHLISMLSISNSDNFICSGHKQLDISIFAHSEKELVYNLYPLCVGWQNLPELTLEYNTVVDPSKDEAQNRLLNELVQRSIPTKVFVLPPMKQQLK